jgi:chitin synthase
LLSINTYTSSTKGLDGGKEGSAMAGAEDMADRAYLRMGHRSENQSILFLFVIILPVSCPSLV